MQTLGLMVEVEGQAFERRLSTFLPLLSSCLKSCESEAREWNAQELDVAVCPATVTQRDELEMETDETAAQSVMFSKDEEEKEGDEEGEKEEDKEEDIEEEEEEAGRPDNMAAALDHLLFSTLSTLEKICGACSVIRGSTYCDHMNNLWGT